jgi:hypothetical protein
METIVKRRIALEDMLDQCTVITVPSGKVYKYIPYWFEFDGDTIRILGYDKLPEELINKINDIHNGK